MMRQRSNYRSHNAMFICWTRTGMWWTTQGPKGRWGDRVKSGQEVRDHGVICFWHALNLNPWNPADVAFTYFQNCPLVELIFTHGSMSMSRNYDFNMHKEKDKNLN